MKISATQIFHHLLQLSLPGTCLSLLRLSPFKLLLQLRVVVISVHKPHEGHAAQGDDAVAHLENEDESRKMNGMTFTEASLTIVARGLRWKNVSFLMCPLP